MEVSFKKVFSNDLPRTRSFLCTHACGYCTLCLPLEMKEGKTRHKFPVRFNFKSLSNRGEILCIPQSSACATIAAGKRKFAESKKKAKRHVPNQTKNPEETTTTTTTITTEHRKTAPYF